ncbi:MAG: acetyl-CoA hydrolase [Ruminiclostridium sp.]|nr:acetyl-CoA hydrolase [Ruminiclostridium sp.]
MSVLNDALARQFREKELTPTQAAALVKSGQKVYIGCCTSYARAIADALAARSEELEDVTIGLSNIFPPMSLLDCANPKAFRFCTYFVGYEDRRALKAGALDYTSVHLGQVDQWCYHTFRPDIAFLDVSSPDSRGYMSHGASGCCMHPFIQEVAGTIVLHINRFSPYVYGERTLIHVSDANYVVFADAEKETTPGGPVEEDDPDVLAMARFLLDEIPDGGCIQLGIGEVATAVGFGLTGKNDLGCHTELMTDSIMALMKAGVINNSRPKFIPKKSVVGFAFGSRELYEYLDHNENIYFGPFPVVNNPANIAWNDNMVSINTAMSIDLFGQVAAEGMGTRQFSGVGGQLDYIRGAQMAKGGKSFLAFRSTLGENPDGSPKSRILPYFPPATIITTPRSDVQYVVTEYGMVNLKHLTVRDRAKALIDISHPDCRADLTAQAKKLGIL